MKINKIEPQGYCNGVKRALDIIDEAINNPSTKKPIYLLGSIIHNKNVVNSFINKGVILVDDKNKTRLELLDSINDGSVVFSAHGVSPLVYKKAIEKKLNIIDATCGYVKIVHQRINDYLNKGYEIIYIGTKNHPECEGVLGISDKIHFITNEDDINNLNIDNKLIYCTNQTTLSKYDISNLFNKLNNKYKNIVIDDKICNATTIRQEAMKSQPKADLCIVVGDKLSSNTKKLAKVSLEQALIKTILVEDLNELKSYDLKNVNTINISSGASTPSYIVDEIINYLEEL